MTSDSEGQGQMTCLGRFAGELPLDMRLSMLIHYGIALGASVHSTSLSQSAPFLLPSFLTTNFPACLANIHFSFTVLLTSHLLQPYFVKFLTPSFLFQSNPKNIPSPFSLFFILSYSKVSVRRALCSLLHCPNRNLYSERLTSP